MLKRVLLGCVVAVGLVGAACGGDDGGDDNGGTDAGNTGCGVDTYNSFIKPLFSANCIACHDATPVGNDLSLNTYAGVKAEQSHVIEHAVENKEPSMPYLMDPLPAAQRDRIRAWYECGAPEGVPPGN